MQRLLFLFLIIINCVLVYSIVFSDRGVFAYLEARKRHTEVSARVEALQEECVALSREIRLLRDDDEYLERIIRRQMHFVRDGEVLYVFPKPSDDIATGAQEDG